MTTRAIWEKHFGDVPDIGLRDQRVIAFFEDLNQACLAEDRAKTQELEQQQREIQPLLQDY